jgi:hypothetical protein
MNINDIIYATTCRDRQGFCHVTYCDGTTDIIANGIGELYERLCHLSNRGRYFMIGRSSFICENNIVKINPSRGKLVMGFDTLSAKHQELDFSDYLLRELRNNIIY